MPRLIKNSTIVKSLQTKIEKAPPLAVQHEAINIQANQPSQCISEIKQALAGRTSISGPQFSKLFALLLSCANYQNIQQIVELFFILVCHNYDQEEVITQMKRCRQIDPVYVLALAWKYYAAHLKIEGKDGNSMAIKKLLGILNLMLVCYPVDLMLHGNNILQKWLNILTTNVFEIDQARKVNNILSTIKCRQGSNSLYNLTTFYDIRIPL